MQAPRLREITETLFSIASMLANYDSIISLPDCNDCANKNCEYRPAWGEPVRINCPLHEKEEPHETL